jgi:hypothetical protein
MLLFCAQTVDRANVALCLHVLADNSTDDQDLHHNATYCKTMQHTANLKHCNNMADDHEQKETESEKKAKKEAEIERNSDRDRERQRQRKRT